MNDPAPKPCPFCLWQPDERFIQLPRNWVEHTSVGDCVLKGMAFPIEQWNSRAHYSDCAVHNDPAYNNGECTCGRPQQSAEPVCRPNPETQAADEYRLLRKHLQECAHLAYLIDMMDAEKRYDRIPELCKELRGLLGESLRGEFRSPVEAVPVSALRELADKWTAQAVTDDQINHAVGRYGTAKDECALDISAVIRGTKT